MKQDRAATLQQIVATIQRRWGTRALRILGVPANDPAIPVVSSGFAEIDAALHIGGLPRGRLTELLGTPTSGMTTLALTVLARAQAQGDLVGYIERSEIRPVVAATFSLEDIVAAQRLFLTKQHVGKIVLTVAAE